MPVFCHVYQKPFSFRGVFYQDQITGSRVKIGLLLRMLLFIDKGSGALVCKPSAGKDSIDTGERRQRTDIFCVHVLS